MFRTVDGQLATSATQSATFTAGGGVNPGLGLRVTATYRETNNVAWTLRADDQVPLRSRIQDWPNGQVAWAITPSKQNIGRILPRLAAQVAYRQSETTSEQPTFELGGSVVTRTTDETLSPSLSLTLVGGILLTTDWPRSNSDRLAAGSLFHTERNAQNTSLTFSFRPPGGSSRWRNVIRTTAGYNVIQNTTCLRGAGQETCVPYVDSRQSQAQLTLDTDLPSNMGAGLQMAYVLNEERQLNRKISQFVITAFVQISASVGQLK